MSSENINFPYITEYLRNLLPKREGLLLEIEEKAKIEDSYVPIAEPETEQLLSLLIDMQKPKNILEIGTGSAYSAISMAIRSRDIKVLTVERYGLVANVARDNIKKANLSDRITLVTGEATEVLKDLKNEFDMIFLDAAKAQYIKFLPDILRILKKGGLLVSDNVLYKGMTAEKSLLVRRKITIVKRLRMYLEEISDNPYLTTSVLPLGDGVALSWRNNKDIKEDQLC